MKARYFIFGIILFSTMITAIWIHSPRLFSAVLLETPPTEHRHADQFIPLGNEAACRHENHDKPEFTPDHHAPRPHGHHHGDTPQYDETCPEHGVAESIDALCHGEYLSTLSPGQGMLLRLANPEVAEKAGITLVTPTPIHQPGAFAFHGRVVFNRNRYARITPLASGVVRHVHVQPGDQVAQAGLLVEIAIPEIASLKAQLAAARAKTDLAQADYEREKDLLARGVTARREFEQARADFHSARSAVDQFRMQLRNYGLSEADIQAFQQTGNNSAIAALRAPLAGYVAELTTSPGETASPDTPLLTVVNLDTLWIELSIPADRIYQIRPDTPVKACFKGLPDRIYTGRIFHVGAAVDPRTHVVRALAEVNNPGHRLKAGMFGRVRLDGETSAAALAVPRDAVQVIDGKPYLFIQRGPDLYEVRRVAVGSPDGDRIPVHTGIDVRERLVATQGFSLKSEILKARLGASCADH